MNTISHNEMNSVFYETQGHGTINHAKFDNVLLTTTEIVICISVLKCISIWQLLQ